METNDFEQINLSRLTVEDIMDFEEKDLDLLLENIRSQLKKNRIHIEQTLETL